MKERVRLRIAKCKSPRAGKTGYNHSRSPYPRADYSLGKHMNKQGFVNTIGKKG